MICMKDLVLALNANGRLIGIELQKIDEKHLVFPTLKSLHPSD